MRKIPIPAKIAAAVAAVGVAAAGSYALFSGHDRQAPRVQPAVPPQARTSPTVATSQAAPQPITSVLTLLAADEGRRACSSDNRWCVSLAKETDDEGIRRPILRRAGERIGAAGDEADPVDDVGADETYVVWPKLIVLGDGSFLAGVETRLSTTYSGGGGSATELRLFRVTRDGAAVGAPVLTLPVRASLLIRACFSEEDLEKRAEACHDEYGFTGQVGVEASGSGTPPITYATQAWAFPRGVSRDADSTTRGPLQPADLVREPDKVCSFSRRFEFDDATKTYLPDRPLPDCSAYTVP